MRVADEGARATCPAFGKSRARLVDGRFRRSPASVFGTLPDRSAGSFRLGPADAQVPASRRYLPGTKILETTWQTRTAWLVLTDFLAVGPWHRTRERSALHRRVPGDFDADHVLVRIATCVYGGVEIALDCEPAFDYDRTDATWEYTAARIRVSAVTRSQGTGGQGLHSDDQ